jgi:purine-cytosine permease-like protein
MWASGTMNLSCFTTGFLGWELGLSLSQTIWITIVASFLGSSITVGGTPLHSLLLAISSLIAENRAGVRQWVLQLASDKSA